MKAYRVDADDSRLLDPQSPEWDRITPSSFTLSPTPITAQPSMYVQAKWKEAPYGTTSALSAKAVHNDTRIYFHLSWPDQTHDDGIRDTDQFPDAAAVLFPVNDDAPLLSMGSPQQPVNAWYWRPDLETPYDIYAQGTGTTQRGVDPDLRGGGQHGDAGWSIVLGRSLASSNDGRVTLTPGQTAKAAFAVWEGGNKERGGLKAVTLEWQPLEIEA